MNLRGARLHSADLEGANLDGADVRGADLQRANVTGTLLSRVETAAGVTWFEKHALRLYKGKEANVHHPEASAHGLPGSEKEE